MQSKSEIAHKVLSQIIFYITFVSLFFLYGCNSTLTSTSLVNEQSRSSTVIRNNSKVNFKLLLPKTYRANTISTTNAEISIYILNYGNSINNFTQLKKKVAIASGTAQATFSNVPAGFVIGDIKLNGASIDGFKNYHGIGDLYPNITTTIYLAASGSKMTPDVLANAALLIASDTELTKVVPVNMADKLSITLSNLNTNQASDSVSVYSAYKSSLSSKKITNISSGAAHSLAIKDDGSVFIWGDNSSGQITETTIPKIFKPTYSQYIYNTSKIAAGEDSSMAIMSDGTVKAWGSNSSGQIPGTPESYVFPPVTISGLPSGETIKSISIGSEHAIALTTSEHIIAWGANSSGELGLSKFSAKERPTTINTLSSIIDISAGKSFSIALKDDKTVWGWGNNDFFQLGSTVTSSSVPLQISGLSDVKKISAGSTHYLALKSNGTVWAWGTNFSGECGLATTTQIIPIPQQITGLDGIITSIATGKGHSLVVKSDGTVWAWGSNSGGQIGQAPKTDTLFYNSPIQVLGLGNISKVIAGSDFSIAIANDGNIWAWGNNEAYQLGKGSNISSHSPNTISFSR